MFTVKGLLLIIIFQVSFQVFLWVFQSYNHAKKEAPFLSNYSFFHFLTVSCVVSRRYWREAAIAQFLLKKNLLLSCKLFSSDDSHSSKPRLLSHRGHIIKTSLVECVAKYLIFLCLLSFVSGWVTYSWTASFGNIGSLTNIAPSFTNPGQSDKHGTLL